LSDISLDNIRVSTNQPCLLAASKSTINSKNGKRIGLIGMIHNRC